MKLDPAQVVIDGWLVDCRVAKAEFGQNRLVKQTHGNNIVWLDEVNGPTEADGIAIKSDSTTGGSVVTSDCLPLVIATKTAAVALHISRKTLVNGLMDRVQDYIKPASITGVYIGPHICPDHFVFEWVGEEIKEFKAQFPGAFWESKDGCHLCVREAVVLYLNQWGVGSDLILEDGRCTYEDLRLPSYRRSLAAGINTGAYIETRVMSNL